MSILEKLSSQQGQRTNTANHEVAEKCLQQPALLKEIVEGLKDKNARLVADCAEVFTEVSKINPELVAPHVAAVLPLINHKHSRARWESMHTLASIVHLIPELIAAELGVLLRIVENDESIIVRDYAVDTIGNYGGTGTAAAKKALPLLKECLDAWDGRHAARVLEGLARVAVLLPERKKEIQFLAEPFLESPKAVVKKAAKRLQKL